MTSKVNSSHDVPACPGARTVNKQVMHRLCQVASVFLGLEACLLAGCVGEPRSAPIARIFVADPVGTVSPGAANYGDIVHDTAVRALRSGGFEAAGEPQSADATLSLSWHSQSRADGSPEGRVHLRMRLVARDGRTVRVIDIIDGLAASLLTRSKVEQLVQAGLSGLGPAPLEP